MRTWLNGRAGHRADARRDPRARRDPGVGSVRRAPGRVRGRAPRSRVPRLGARTDRRQAAARVEVDAGAVRVHGRQPRWRLERDGVARRRGGPAAVVDTVCRPPCSGAVALRERGRVGRGGLRRLRDRGARGAELRVRQLCGSRRQGQDRRGASLLARRRGAEGARDPRALLRRAVQGHGRATALKPPWGFPAPAPPPPPPPPG
jgi:hypothetical protein